MKLLVCGGRDYSDREKVYAALSRFLQRGDTIEMVVHGGAPGADTLAGDWATLHNIPQTRYPANWQEHGKAAGPIRNQTMADDGADGCIAFPGGRGTADMVRRAKAAGIPVWEPLC